MTVAVDRTAARPGPTVAGTPLQRSGQQ